MHGEKFDPDGNDARQYVPELARLPTEFIHPPWTASPLELAAAGVKPGNTDPAPIGRASVRLRPSGA